MSRQKYVTAKEVANLLEISVSTVYSYVSRGYLRSVPTEDTKRTKYYYYEDVEHLLAKKEARRKPSDAAKKTLHWGAMPLLDSAISLIENNRLFYRGVEVTQLVDDGYSFEDVATFLWTGDLKHKSEFGAENRHTGILRQLAKADTITKIQMALPFAATKDPYSFDIDTSRVEVSAQKIIRLMVDITTNGKWHGSVARSLAITWKDIDSRAIELVNASLILVADHELNASSFATRVAASTNASPYHAINAGISTLLGPKHGMVVYRIQRFLDEIEQVGSVDTVIQRRLKDGVPIPEFDHPLYPEGDPRGEMLLSLANEFRYSAEINSAIKAVERYSGKKPTLDWGLVAVANALGQSVNVAFLIFMIGRTAGWMAHIMEQYHMDSIIRPRAHYVGQRPEGK